ncbi:MULTISPECIES: DUF3558 domain-containing protein [unclassified Crossiella]|uniref:DUF3558 domain-containing protein n=1 Tax=unclassified Crossiella TaxID=2620835 RepID=UPI001FFF26E9|nr:MULTISPECIES: DUF3558 domain-containing protein [unclassified Crossiella]MCK2238349.1 DUF3558 domain-containing protein [Crossiella sp. S99.2]MCK2256389.1 DUF3558 domain-containing protein [Crossiella sp. S99.1]
MSRPLRLPALLLGCLVLAACTPPPAKPTAPNPPPVAITTPSISLPPRPREIKLDRVDPCTLLTTRQRRTLGMDRPPLPTRYPTMGNAKVCDFRDSTRALTVRIGLVLVQGVGVWLEETAQADVKAATVAEFPAVIVRTAEQTRFCNVEVDVAQGQFLDIQFGDAGNAAPPGLDAMCASAQEVATAAMTTLMAR